MKYIKSNPVLTTLVISAIIALTSIYLLGKYGLLLFIFVLFLIGFLPGFIKSKSKLISLRESIELGFITLAWSYLCSLIFALEGIICLIMALPLLGIIVLIGASIAYHLQKSKNLTSANTTVILLCFALAFTSFDYFSKPVKLIKAKSEVIINSNIDEVWNNVVSFGTIKKPKEWLFKTGIAYPIDATIIGEGEEAIRYCNFNTGSFVEPITKWDEPHLLQFDVLEQPIPMNEFNPFWDVHPPHLNGYFKSYKGQFQLFEIDDTTTRLVGTTWYKVDIAPKFYWRLWSSFIIHKIHERVLTHIKEESENSTSS